MTSATIHTLLDEVLEVPLFLFISILWKQPDFIRELLVHKIFVKDVDITSWEEVNGKNSRRITGKHPIPGFSWLPWLPLHTNTNKQETMEFVKEQKELTIKEFSKIEDIPWHDIDVNLIWKVRDMGQQVHVVVTVQIVFHTGFIQAFAEMAALEEMKSYFKIWKVDARQALTDSYNSSSNATTMEGPLASILSEVTNSSSFVKNNINQSSLLTGSHTATYNDDGEGMDTWRSVVVDDESEGGVPISSHGAIPHRTDSCEGTVATNNRCLDNEGDTSRSDSPISFVTSAFTGFTSFSDHNEVSSATTTIGTMMSDNLATMSNLFRSSPLVDSGGESTPILHRLDSCEGTVATNNTCLDNDNEVPSTATAMSTMMSDNFTALSNFMTIGPSLFSESSTKNGVELTPQIVESSSKSSDSTDSKDSQLAGSSAVAADIADNDGSSSTSFSLLMPFMDADLSLLSGMQGAMHRMSLSMWQTGDGMLATDLISSSSSSPCSSPSSTTTLLPFSSTSTLLPPSS